VPWLRCLFAALVLALAGCSALSLTMRAQVGAVSDGDRVRPQASATLGFGVALSRRSAGIASAGVTTGTPTLGIPITVDFTRLPARGGVPIGWRVGGHGVVAVIDDPSLNGIHAGAFVVVRDRHGGGGPDYQFKGDAIPGTSSWYRSAMSVGLEARAGATLDDRSGVFGGFVTAEWMFLAQRGLN
jgi:hypothetical protein